MTPKELEALQRRWAENVVPAQPDTSSWDGPAHEVPTAVVAYNRNGDILGVRFLRRPPRPRPKPFVPVARANTATERRPRRRRRAAATSAATKRGPPADEPPPKPRPARLHLSRAERDYLKIEVDRLRREQLAAQRALDRALFAWGRAEIVA